MNWVSGYTVRSDEIYQKMPEIMGYFLLFLMIHGVLFVVRGLTESRSK